MNKFSHIFTSAVLISFAAMNVAEAETLFNKPTCGWWLPKLDIKPVFVGDCEKIAGARSSVKVINESGNVIIITTPPSPPDTEKSEKPGFGFGDSNHTHSGPPGQSNSNGGNGGGNGKGKS